MGVVPDAFSHPASTAGSVASISWTHTPVAAGGFGVIVGVINIASLSVDGELPTCTYGGVAMRQIATFVDSATTHIRVTYFYLASPPTGAQTVVASFGAGANDLAANGLAVSALGDKLGVPTAVFVSNTGNSTSSSVTPVVPLSEDFVIVMYASTTGGAGYTNGGQGPGMTNRLLDNTGAIDIAADTRPGYAGASALTHAVSTGTWIGGSVNFQTMPNETQLLVMAPAAR